MAQRNAGAGAVLQRLSVLQARVEWHRPIAHPSAVQEWSGAAFDCQLVSETALQPGLALTACREIPMPCSLSVSSRTSDTAPAQLPLSFRSEPPEPPVQKLSDWAPQRRAAAVLSQALNLKH